MDASEVVRKVVSSIDIIPARVIYSKVADAIRLSMTILSPWSTDVSCMNRRTHFLRIRQVPSALRLLIVPRPHWKSHDLSANFVSTGHITRTMLMRAVFHTYFVDSSNVLLKKASECMRSILTTCTECLDGCNQNRVYVSLLYFFRTFLLVKPRYITMSDMCTHLHHRSDMAPPP